VPPSELAAFKLHAEFLRSVERIVEAPHSLLRRNADIVAALLPAAGSPVELEAGAGAPELENAPACVSESSEPLASLLAGGCEGYVRLPAARFAAGAAAFPDPIICTFPAFLNVRRDSLRGGRWLGGWNLGGGASESRRTEARLGEEPKPLASLLAGGCEGLEGLPAARLAAGTAGYTNPVVCTLPALSNVRRDSFGGGRWRRSRNRRWRASE